MAANEKNRPATWYIIHIANQVNPEWKIWFEGMELSQNSEGETVLSGELVDQSALYGLLEKIHSLNLGLLSVQKIEAKLDPKIVAPGEADEKV